MSRALRVAVVSLALASLAGALQRVPLPSVRKEAETAPAADARLSNPVVTAFRARWAVLPPLRPASRASSLVDS
jgi:hypothetical protein